MGFTGAAITLCYISLITCVSGKNFTCYTCSYQHPAARDYACVNQPDQVKTAKSVLCPASRVCVTREVFSTASETITSFNRNCEIGPIPSKCVTAGGVRECTYSCTDDLCNSQIGGQLEKVFIKDDKKNGGSSVAVSLLPVSGIWIFFFTMEITMPI